VAGPLLTAATATAQDAGATSFSSADFFIGVQETPGANISNFDIARYFNKARCDCKQKVYIYVALTNSGFAKRTTVDRSGNIEFWIGSDCANTAQGRLARCKLLAAPTLANFLNDGRATMETTAQVVSTYTGAASIDGGTVLGGDMFVLTTTCTSDLESFNQNIYVLQATTGTPATLATRQIAVDLKPPPRMEPALVTLDGVNQAVVLSWPGVDSSVITDMLGYQVLCNRAGEFQVFADGTFGDPGYLLCPDPMSTVTGMPALDPRYLCSGLLAPTTRSHRIKILQNDITYAAGVVAIDRSGNPSVLDIFYATATKSQTFYDIYRDGDMNTEGKASGGFCALGAGTTGRGAAAGLGASITLGIIAVARRRRRRR
jgi:hypothetical protein